MPTNCDPIRKWYQGSVIMDFRVTTSNDLNTMESNLAHFASIGIKALHLRDVTLRPDVNSSDVNEMYHPTSLTIVIAQKLLADGAEYNPRAETGLKQFTAALHALNMSLMVQVPVIGSDAESREGKLSIELQHRAEDAIKYWSEQGVDGVFLDGLEHFGADNWVGRIVERWHDILERYGQVESNSTDR